MSDAQTQPRIGERLLRVLPPVLAALGTVVVIALSYAVFADWLILRADLSTYLLPGVARADGLGSLYVDYFDIKPPLAYAMFVPWLAVFGSSLAGMWVLYAILLALMLAAFWVALRQQLSPWLALLLFGSTAIVVVHFSMLEELFFITEVVCLVLVLWSLVIARSGGHRLSWLFTAALLMGAAGQVKEVFILAPAALLPVAWAHARRWRAVATLAGGVAAALILTLGVLVWWGDGVLAAYGEVFALKRSRFPAPAPGQIAQAIGDHLGEMIRWLPLLALFFVVALAVAVMRAVRDRSDDTAPLTGSWKLAPAEWMLVWFFLTTFAAFVWQGAPLIRHYAVAVVFPLYLALAVLLRHALVSTQWMQPISRRIVSALLIVGLLPSLASVAWAYGRVTAVRPGQIVDTARTLESDEDLAVFRAIAESAGTGGCMQVAYGWSASAYYLYAGVPPCSRFVVPPLALSPQLRDELRQSLIDQPPSVLVIDPGYAVETTVPPEEGDPEVAVFPFQAVAAQCYRQGAEWPTVYTPRNGVGLSECIATQVDATR